MATKRLTEDSTLWNVSFRATRRAWLERFSSQIERGTIIQLRVYHVISKLTFFQNGKCKMHSWCLLSWDSAKIFEWKNRQLTCSLFGMVKAEYQDLTNFYGSCIGWWFITMTRCNLSLRNGHLKCEVFRFLFFLKSDKISFYDYCLFRGLPGVRNKNEW